MANDKFIFIDSETTGLNPKKHSMWQVGCIIDTPKHDLKEFEFKMKPVDPESSDPDSLKFNGITIEDLYRMPNQAEQFIRFVSTLERYVDKFVKWDKFVLVGYNIIQFDQPFLYNWFKLNNNNFYGSYFKYQIIDVYPWVMALHATEKLDTAKCKLEYVAKHLGIEIKAHDALSDIQATRELFYLIVKPWLDSVDFTTVSLEERAKLNNG